jgi:hypothetical protein
MAVKDVLCIRCLRDLNWFLSICFDLDCTLRTGSSSAMVEGKALVPEIIDVYETSRALIQIDNSLC